MARSLASSGRVADYQASPGDYFALMKPRVMSLVVFTTLIGMLASPATGHPVLLAISLLAIAAGAGASGVINQWYDRDIDAVMTRTAMRPIPDGRVHPDEAIGFGMIMALLSVLVLWFSGGVKAALLLAFTIMFYGLVYTVWLKRYTAQNIVIGGAAGAFPPVIGWLAAGGEPGIEPWILFAIIFAWTPPHFWSLALVRNDDYVRAGIPMFPVIHGARATRMQILIYAVIVAAMGVMPTLIGMAGYWYGGFALLLGLRFIGHAVAVWRADDDDSAKPMALFRYSILYLFLLFSAIGLEVIFTAWGT